MAKIKKLFCLKTDMQDRAYEQYVATRKCLKNDKAIMDALKIPRSPSTENGTMTRSKWISAHSEWSDVEDTVTSRPRGRARAEHGDDERDDDEDE